MTTDPFLREQQLLQKAREEAYERGFREGLQSGRSTVWSIPPAYVTELDRVLTILRERARDAHQSAKFSEQGGYDFNAAVSRGETTAFLEALQLVQALSEATSP